MNNPLQLKWNEIWVLEVCVAPLLGSETTNIKHSLLYTMVQMEFQLANLNILKSSQVQESKLIFQKFQNSFQDVHYISALVCLRNVQQHAFVRNLFIASHFWIPDPSQVFSLFATGPNSAMAVDTESGRLLICHFQGWPQKLFSHSLFFLM